VAWRRLVREHLGDGKSQRVAASHERAWPIDRSLDRPLRAQGPDEMLYYPSDTNSAPCLISHVIDRIGRARKQPGVGVGHGLPGVYDDEDAEATTVLRVT
jgi:hypothetical protein